MCPQEKAFWGISFSPTSLELNPVRDTGKKPNFIDHLSSNRNVTKCNRYTKKILANITQVSLSHLV